MNTTKPETGVDAILTERGTRYGKFKDHARISQGLKRQFVAQMGSSKFDGLQPDQQEALEMIFHKLARIANGDPDYADSWVDIAGYAKLVSDRLEGVER
jgi:hypothetical protein